MNSDILLAEIGSVALGDLADSEVAYILSKYTDTDNRAAGMDVFNLLRKKFKPSYRMGKTYEALSDKYKMYDQIFKEYANTISAGAITGTPDSTNNISRWKFTSNAN